MSLGEIIKKGAEKTGKYLKKGRTRKMKGKWFKKGKINAKGATTKAEECMRCTCSHHGRGKNIIFGPRPGGGVWFSDRWFSSFCLPPDVFGPLPEV
jgi:hypothetical protein